MYSYEELVGIIAELRSDHGCPWDKAQTHESMISCLRNECEEVVEAIEQKDPENLCEELGDVLLQVLLHAQIAKEEGLFTMDDVINGLAEKMIRRHPHVFGDEEYGSDEQNQARWEEIKRQEFLKKERIRSRERYQKLKSGERTVGVPVTLTCKCCGQEFASKRTNTLFCGPNCRAKFYRQEAAESRSRACACENCGKEFITTRSDVKYCSDDCRYAAQIKRQGARKKALREAKNEKETKTA